jgi:uncharacterized protein YuzE
MEVKIGNVTFDYARYDAVGDVLYLHVGEPRAAAYGDETPEGHVVRYSDAGDVIGLTIISAKRFLDRDGELVVTMPETQHLPAAAVEPLLAA